MTSGSQTEWPKDLAAGPNPINFGVSLPHGSADAVFRITSVPSDALLAAHIIDDDSQGRFKILSLTSYSTEPTRQVIDPVEASSGAILSSDVTETPGRGYRIESDSPDGAGPLKVFRGQDVEIALRFYGLGPPAGDYYNAALVINDLSPVDPWQPIRSRMTSRIAEIKLIKPAAVQIAPGQRITVPVTAISEAGSDTEVSWTLQPGTTGISMEPSRVSLRGGGRATANLEIAAAFDMPAESGTIRFDGFAYDGELTVSVDVPFTGTLPLSVFRENCQALENVSGPTVLEEQSWSNWGIIDTTQTFLGFMEAPKLYRPTNPYEIGRAIQQAEAENKTIRARGSGWSFSDAVLPQSSPIEGMQQSQVGLIRTWALTGAIGEDEIKEFAHNFSSHFGYAIDTASINGSLQTLIHRVIADDRDPATYFFAEAGMTVRDLNLLLDALDPPMALKTMGGATAQTIAGAISIGTHGADFDRPPLADNVRAIYLIGAGGVHHWIEPNSHITDPVKIQDTYPCISEENVHYDDEMFQAVMVSMGAMGVIYAVILEIVPQYSLLQWNKWSKWEQLKAEIGHTDFAGLFDGSWSQLNNYLSQNYPGESLTNRAVQVVVNPIRNDDGTHNCYVSNRVELSLRDPSGQAPIRDYNEMEYGDVRTAIEASPNFGHHERVQFGLALHHGDLGEDSDPIFLRLQALLRFCKDHDYPWAVGAAIDAFMQRSYPNSVSDGDAYMDVGYKVMASTRTERGFETLDGSAVEAAFSFYKVLPAAEPSGLYITVPDVITFIDSVLDAFDNSVDSPDKAFPAGYLSLRVCGRTDALFGMERFDRNGMVEVVLISSPDGYHLVRQVEEIARNQGAALHWGQSNGLMEFIDLEFVYGNSRIDRWRAVQRQLGGETFTNYFMQRCGLSEQNRGGW